MIHTEIQKDIRAALKEGNKIKLTTLRGLLSAFTNELVANKRKPDETLNDEEAQVVIKREIKKHKGSIVQFKDGGREDLVKNEEEELTYLEELFS